MLLPGCFLLSYQPVEIACPKVQAAHAVTGADNGARRSIRTRSAQAIRNVAARWGILEEYQIQMLIGKKVNGLVFAEEWHSIEIRNTRNQN